MPRINFCKRAVWMSVHGNTSEPIMKEIVNARDVNCDFLQVQTEVKK